MEVTHSRGVGVGVQVRGLHGQDVAGRYGEVGTMPTQAGEEREGGGEVGRR